MPVLANPRMREAVGDDAVLGSAGIGFRRLRISDLPLMQRWFKAPHVARWWYDEGTSRREVEDEYIPYIEGREPVHPYLILYREQPIGYIQVYPISHDDEYARLVDVEGSSGIDLFIGETEYLYRGLGASILRRFLAEEVFSDPAVEVCVIGPEPKNTAAIRSYEKAGFRYFKTIQVPAEREPEYLMRMTRDEFETDDSVT